MHDELTPSADAIDSNGLGRPGMFMTIPVNLNDCVFWVTSTLTPVACAAVGLQMPVAPEQHRFYSALLYELNAPVGGRANAALLRFVADVLKLPPAAIVLKSGHASRRKVVEVSGATREAVAALSQPS